MADGMSSPKTAMEATDLIDHDVLYWNAHALLKSPFFAAKKRALVLSAAHDTVRLGQWDMFSREAIPAPFYEAWQNLCSDTGSLGALIQEGLREVGLEDVLHIIENHPESKLAHLLLSTLDFAVDIGAFWSHFHSLAISDALALEAKLGEVLGEFEKLQNGRPRLLLRQEVGLKSRSVQVEYYRADITDIPFQEGDVCFFLVSKFGDQPMLDVLKSKQMTTLGALASKYEGLKDRAELIEQSGGPDQHIKVVNDEFASHAVRVWQGLPSCNVPFGLGVVDVCRSQADPVDLQTLYADLMCLDKVLLEHDTTHLLTVLTGFGPKAFSCFEQVEVAHVLAELNRLIGYLARHCRTLRRVTVATFNPQAANEIRHYLADGKLVSENSIDRLRQNMATPEVTGWLETYGLRNSAEQFVEKAMQTVERNRKDYHCQLCLEMRELVGRFVEHFLMAKFGIMDAYVECQRARFGTSVHLMAGQVAHWMKEHARSISKGRDRAKLLSACELIIYMNQSYINPGLHKENMTDEKLHAMESIVTTIFDRLTDLLLSSVGWDPCPTQQNVLHQLRGGSPAAAHLAPGPPGPVRSDPRRSPTSALGCRRPTPVTDGAIHIQPLSGLEFRVAASGRYLIGGRPAPVCELFKTGQCAARPGMCRLAHPCRFQGRCRNMRTCIFDHPEPEESDGEDSIEVVEESSESDGEEPELVYSVSVCKFFQRSSCRFGGRCRFAHPCTAGRSCVWSDCQLAHPIH